MTFFKNAVISIFFLLELSTLAALMYWGFHLNKGILMKIVCGVGAPVIAAIIWGTFIAPKASFLVSIPLRIILQIIVFGSAIVALHYADQKPLALTFLTIATIEMILMHTMKL